MAAQFRVSGVNSRTEIIDLATGDVLVTDARDLFPRGSLSQYAYLQGEIVDMLPGVGFAFAISRHHLARGWVQGTETGQTHAKLTAIVARLDEQHIENAIASIRAGYGLTATEADLSRELLIVGGFDKAVNVAQLNYTAARNALVRLRKKFGTANLAETVHHLSTLAFPQADESGSIDRNTLAELLGLSSRQLALATMLTEGKTRDQAASLLEITPSVAKAEAAKIFEILSVSSVGELAALIGQASRVGEILLQSETAGERLSSLSRSARIATASGRRIGYSMFGKSDGPTVLIMHSTVTCRHPPSRMAARLLARGWSILTIDRPGFGETDVPQEAGIDAHIAAAAEDLHAVMKEERISSLNIIARGSAQIAVAMQSNLNFTPENVMLVTPAPSPEFTERDKGPLGAIKRQFIRRPTAIRALIRLLLTIASRTRMEESMRRAFAKSPADTEALADPLVVDDYFRATIALKDNLEGYVTENSAWGSGWCPSPPSHRGKGWTVVTGKSFALHDPKGIEGYFAHLLPQARVLILKDAGTMAAYSHGREIADIFLNEISPATL